METKVCCTCKRELSIDNFSFKNKTEGTRSLECKECHRIYNRKWYLKHSQERIACASVRNKERAKLFSEYKNTLSCQECGEDHPATLDFHHRNPDEKDMTICEMNQMGYSWERVLKEIEKCDVLCSNCHRKLHYRVLV